MKALRSLTGMICLVGLVSCGHQSELTRSKAKTSLDSSELFNSIKLPPTIVPQELVDCGLREGLWEMHEVRDLGVGGRTWNHLTQTSKAAGEYSIDNMGAGPLFELKRAVKRQVVEIQGIRDLPTSEGKQKDAEFTWSFYLDDWPPSLKPCLLKKDKYTADALFVLYDDGWRLSSVGASRIVQ